jgi:tRNA(fMet)-specific endonuclease VapC
MARKVVLLDTCILINLQRGNVDVLRKVYEFGQDNIFITPVVIAEFFRGARNKEEFEKCRKLVSKFRIVSLDQNVVNVFSRLYEQYAISHRPSVPDMLIASTAIAYKITLFTHNRKDFQFIPDIDLLV